jgi:hypothetical protein
MDTNWWKSEGRNPKAERNPNSETRIGVNPEDCEVSTEEIKPSIDRRKHQALTRGNGEES